MAHIILQKVLFIVIMILLVHNHCTVGSTCLSSMNLILSPGTISTILNVVLSLFTLLCITIEMGRKHGIR